MRLFSVAQSAKDFVAEGCGLSHPWRINEHELNFYDELPYSSKPISFSQHPVLTFILHTWYTSHSMTPPCATSLSFQRKSKKRQAEATASLAAAWTGYVSDVFAWTLSVFYMFGFRDVIGKMRTLGAGI